MIVLSISIIPNVDATTISVSPFADEFVIVGENVPDGEIFYLPSNGDGTFGTPTFMTNIGLRLGTGVGDLDSDGDLDFVAGTRQSSCSVTAACVSFYLFENKGNGDFVQTLIEDDVPGGTSLSNNYPSDMGIGDFNKDGYNDFVSGVYQTNFVYLYTNNQDNTFSRTTLTPTEDPADVKAGDFDEDGNMDFLIAEYFASKVHLYKGDGTGSFSKQLFLTVPGNRAATLAVEDFNEDNHLDVVVGSLGDNDGWIYFGDGNGNSAFQNLLYDKDIQTNLDAYDFDNDGFNDLILSDWENPPSPKVYWQKGNGDGTFQTEIIITTIPAVFLTVSTPTISVPNLVPDCSGSSPSVETITKSNHKLIDISIEGVTDGDGDSISITITAITQDEPTSGLERKDKSPDGFGILTDTAQIRAERDGQGNGRVYEISFDSDDGNGGQCSGSVNIVVPKNKKVEPVDDGQNFDSTQS